MTRHCQTIGFGIIFSLGCITTISEKSDTSASSGVVDPIPEPQPYGPENNWYHADVADVVEPASCGLQLGQTMCNFTMTDQNGDSVELYQFFGKVVVLDLYADW